jgi:hypothetical protein
MKIKEDQLDPHLLTETEKQVKMRVQDLHQENMHYPDHRHLSQCRWTHRRGNYLQLLTQDTDRNLTIIYQEILHLKVAMTKDHNNNNTNSSNINNNNETNPSLTEQLITNKEQNLLHITITDKIVITITILTEVMNLEETGQFQETETDKDKEVKLLIIQEIIEALPLEEEKDLITTTEADKDTDKLQETGSIKAIPNRTITTKSGLNPKTEIQTPTIEAILAQITIDRDQILKTEVTEMNQDQDMTTNEDQIHHYNQAKPLIGQ